MAHLVETMAFTGQTPWHGLGNQLTPNQPLEVWAEQAGMDWRIESSAKYLKNLLKYNRFFYVLNLTPHKTPHKKFD